MIYTADIGIVFALFQQCKSLQEQRQDNTQALHYRNSSTHRIFISNSFDSCCVTLTMMRVIGKGCNLSTRLPGFECVGSVRPTYGVSQQFAYTRSGNMSQWFTRLFRRTPQRP